jgi:glyoxylase-like metal-dependent hydrolase (beta-lactamase superfamily II)
MGLGMNRVVEGVYVVAMGRANGYLIEGTDGLALIDAGFPKKEAALFDALRRLGRSPRDLKHLILTHGHPDHVGSAAAIVRETGAQTYMHPVDTPLAESGGPFRPMTPAPGLLRQILCRTLYDKNERLEPVAISRAIVDGETLPIAGGIDVVHVPGHCAGQVALFWRPGRVLFAADVFMNITGLGDPLGFESHEAGRASQRRLAAMSFDAVGFGHGSPITRNAAARLRKWTGLGA